MKQGRLYQFSEVVRKNAIHDRVFWGVYMVSLQIANYTKTNVVCADARALF